MKALITCPVVDNKDKGGNYDDTTENYANNSYCTFPEWGFLLRSDR